jgi:acyl-CoA reductase-like NAD-dependent aldehyde dehydrogenase
LLTSEPRCLTRVDRFRSGTARVNLTAHLLDSHLDEEALTTSTLHTDTGSHPIFVAGRWVASGEELVVRNPFDDSTPAGATFLASESQYEAAVEGAVGAFAAGRRSAAYERGDLLRAISAGVTARREDLARLIALEIGKPIRDAFIEVDRTALAFRLAAAEAERIGGEVIPLDAIPTSRGRVGITRRFPIGPIAAISPFNLPLGLSVHKLAPAIAAGAPIVLRPPSKAPLALLVLAEIIDAAGAPPGSVSIVPMTRELGDRMVADERFKLLTFTGSPAVGWAMKARAGKKKVLLELGGNAAAIIDRTADLDRAATRCVTGAFKFAGQLCVSIQRLVVHEAVLDPFLDRFVALTGALRLGDPLNATTDIGPMIDPGAIARTSAWIEEAVGRGARIIAGGRSDGAFFQPTILAEVPSDARVCVDEAFAPLVVVSTFRDFETALAEANDSRYGLQAGVFTNDLGHAWAAFDILDVGGVIVNDIPSYRIDQMPFGGVKDSGQGREGLRWAIEEMTELKLMVVAPV